MFIVCGINHRTAPIVFREKLSIPAPLHPHFIEQLLATTKVEEATVLTTCNRTELYCTSSEPEIIKNYLAQYCHLSSQTLTPHWYQYQGQPAVKHALRVASGLDSMMLGEPQILGQIKQAYAQSCELGSAKKTLQHVFPFIFRASKRIRHQSGIGQSPISVAYVAAQKILNSISSPENAKIFIIGSGEMAKLVAKYLSEAGVKQFYISSRTQDHAQQLANHYQAQVVPLTNLKPILKIADVVITASTCPVPFITPEFLSPILPERNGLPLFLLDLALPRNITEETAHLPHIALYNIDMLNAFCQVGQKTREKAASFAETLVEQELDHFLRWSDAQQIKIFITHYREQMQMLSQKELTRAMDSIRAGEATDVVLEKLTHRLFKKLTHLPTLSMRQAAMRGYSEFFDLAQQLNLQFENDPNN